MIKKYGSKIFTSVSFTGIAISNIKAVEKTGDVTIMIGEKAYTNSGSTLTKSITAPVDVLCEIGNKFGNSLKDADSQAIDLTCAEKNYFIKEIKCLFNPIDKKVKFNEADGQCNINTDGQISIELVKKEDVIGIVYDHNCKKKLKDSSLKTIFETIVQGVALKDLGLDAIISDTSTLEGIAISGEEVLGKDIQLPTDNNKIQLIVNDIKEGNFRTFILELSDEVKSNLVKGLDLSKFNDLDTTTIPNDNIGKSAFEALNKIQVTCTAGDVNFFKGKFEILKEGDENIKVETDKDAAVDSFSGGSFYILKDIKKENINAKYLKKTFDVKLDSADTNKAVDTEDINTLIKALNKEFGDSLNFSTNDIWTELKKQNTIIKDTFNSSIKINKVGTDTDKAIGNKDDLVDENTTEFIIKLPEEAFANGVVQGAITLTFDTNNIKKGSRKLKNEIISAIEDAMKKINTKTTTDNFATKINSIDSLKRVNNENFVADDFNFGSTVESGNDITKDGTITLKPNGIAKIDDSCFEEERKPKTNDSKGNSGSGDSDGSDEQNKKKSGYSCRKKNN